MTRRKATTTGAASRLARVDLRDASCSTTARDFPSQIPISESAKSVIQALLSREPESRPSVEELINHDFFTRHTIVPSIPTTALKEIPDFSTPAPPSTISNSYIFMQTKTELPFLHQDRLTRPSPDTSRSGLT
ncbi:hypothetical protein DFJ73DRAFT_241219 [Zopfochytrium polystomum]|nr:hypothetical protein DFJ73DRAFT_241219 [Zopfochytrium polystomum]